ncbi:MAG: TetR family transcriptional regulator [Deltaproteobacteria bacterium]|nr:MAG: TetR family transcriptional regulator [Deltaproteobacteria bacterium]
MREKDTKERILDAAERIFAERGFAGTSLRAVTSAADVNLAAVHYHFGSKEALLQEILHRRVAPINQERAKRLDRIEARAAEEPPSVEEIVAAFLEPAVQLGDGPESDGRAVRALAARIYGEPRELVEPMIREEFGDLSRRFVALLGRARPELSRSEIESRFQFAVGVLIFVIAERYVSNLTPDSELDLNDREAIVRRMSAFIVHGLCAPPADARSRGGS